MTTYEKSIVITGASSGIGRATALYLDQLGFRVFAGVRKEADGISLKNDATDNLTYLLLDVTDGEAVEVAVETVARIGGGRLYGLVNNAGVSLNAPLELVPVDKIQQVIDVNVVGLLSVTKAFIPLLRRGKGRIINISSGHGLLAVPDKSVYAASKFAVQAITDSLRLELHPFDIEVTSVVVGKVNTEVLGKIVADREQVIAASSPEIVKLYQQLLSFFDREVKELPGIPASDVATVIADALTTASPKSQYLIGPGASKMQNLARLPVGLRDWLMVKALYK